MLNPRYPKAIRSSSHPDAKAVPIITMTANAFREDVEQALSAGMDGHLAKPVETELLYQTLNEAAEIRHRKADINFLHG